VRADHAHVPTDPPDSRAEPDPAAWEPPDTFLDALARLLVVAARSGPPPDRPDDKAGRPKKRKGKGKK
jgi:hypothetical protein